MSEVSMMVEIMQSDELNQWVVEALKKMTDDDKRGVATMSVMISMFQDFMEENPEVAEAFEVYMNDGDEYEQIH
jgi:type IV secretory pathway TraG/TraD family ATPase VirD4